MRTCVGLDETLRDYTWKTLFLNKDSLYLLSHLHAIARWELYHLRCGKDVDFLLCVWMCVLLCVLIWLCLWHFSFWLSRRVTLKSQTGLKKEDKEQVRNFSVRTTWNLEICILDQRVFWWGHNKYIWSYYFTLICCFRVFKKATFCMWIEQQRWKLSLALLTGLL